MYSNFKEYLQSINNFSGNVLIAKNGEIILKESFGYMDTNQMIKNTLTTNFKIASITKSFTALCIMQLVEKGYIKLDDKIDGLFPGLYSGEGISIHNLLNQTSGIRNYIYYKELQTGQEFTPSQIIEFMTTKPLKFKPGKKWSYSNTNYLLLGQIIEKVSGKSYHEYVKNFIFKPLGMNRSYFDSECVENLAEHGKSVFNCNPSLLYAAGDIVSNIDDLLLYDQALYTDELLSYESLNKMHEASYQSAIVKYGYGWFIKNNFEKRSVSHGGFHPIGYTSNLERYIDERVTVIVLSNKLEKYSTFGIKYFGSIDVGRELAARFFNKKAWFWQKLT